MGRTRDFAAEANSNGIFSTPSQKNVINGGRSATILAISVNASPPLTVYETLAREHSSMLLAYILALVPDRMEAEDLTQETLIVAYHKLDSLEREESFAPWLRGIARHLCLSFLRKKKREFLVEPEVLEGLESGFEAFDNAQTQDEWLGRIAVIHQCLDALPEKLSNVFRRHYLEEQKVKEIAEEQSVAVAAVLKRLERARDSVKECVQRRLRREDAHE